MATKTLVVTVEIEVRDPTEAELSDGQFQNDDYEMIDPLDWLSDLSPDELREPIEAALHSENNPEMFAGTGLFVQTTSAQVTAAHWKP
jgi:hypothetical protein